MATSSHMSSTKDVASLLSSPVEIRGKIYRHLLVASHNLHPYASWDSWLPNLTEGSGIYTSILATCKQVAFEATHILYTSNVFKFDGCKDMNEWLDTISPDDVQAVQNAEINGSYAMMGMDALKKVVRRCTGLRRLHLRQLTELFIRGIFELAKSVLKDHPNLRIVACKHWGDTPKGASQTWKVGFITLVANTEDLLPKDGKVVDIEEAIEEYDESQP